MSQDTARYPSPMLVYARVSQGFLPVLGANVTAVIEAEDGHQVTLELWDNGAGNGTGIDPELKILSLHSLSMLPLYA